MDVLGMLTGGLGNIGGNIGGMLLDNIVPIIAIVGAGAFLNAQGVDVIGNLSTFGNDAINSFLGMIDGIQFGKEKEQEQVPTETINLEETHGTEFNASDLTIDEQKSAISDILMTAKMGDTPETILDKASEKLHLTDEQKESARGIVNDVYAEMYQIKNVGRDRGELVEEAMNLAEEKGLFEVIGSNQSISEQTVSMETVAAAVPKTNDQTQPKAKDKGSQEVDIDMER